MRTRHAPRPGLGYLFGVFRAGDFDGDGSAELGYLDSGPTGTVWEWETDSFGSGQPWVESTGFRSPEEVTVSDVDGDGYDDLVYLSGSLVRVLQSTGESFERRRSFTFTVDSKDISGTIDPVDWRGY